MVLKVLYVEEQIGVPSEDLLPLLSKEVDVHLLTARSPRIPQARYASMTLTSPPRFGLANSLMLSRLAISIVREQKINVVLGSMSVDWLLWPSAPVVTRNGGSWYVGWKMARARWRRGRYRLPFSFAHYVVPEFLSTHRSRQVLAVSESVRQDLVRLHGLAPEKVSVNYNAAPSALYADAWCKRATDPPHLVYTGRLHWMKGILDFVRAFSASNLDAPFTIAGDGPDREAIQRLAANDDRIRLLPLLCREDVYKLLARTNVFVFPSLYEGHSLSLLEAMTTGHACVVIDTPSLAETLGPTAGCISPSIEGMIRDIEMLISDPKRRFGLQEGAASRARDFSWQATASGVLRTLQETARDA